MTKKSPYVEAFEAEMENWPDVFYEIENASKHFQIHMFYGIDRRVFHLSRGSRNGRKGTANLRADIRRMMLEMGVPGN